MFWLQLGPPGLTVWQRSTSQFSNLAEKAEKPCVAFHVLAFQHGLELSDICTISMLSLIWGPDEKIDWGVKGVSDF